MYMIDCEMLVAIKKRIESGENPENVIPYHLNCDKETFIEICHYALQVLPEGRRKEEIRNCLILNNASR